MLDLINGSFEALATAAVLTHCKQIQRDQAVKGVSIPAVIFFTAWGFWNMFYYPALGQPFSFVAGSCVAAANCWYVSLLMKYRKGSPHEAKVTQIF